MPALTNAWEAQKSRPSKEFQRKRRDHSRARLAAAREDAKQITQSLADGTDDVMARRSSVLRDEEDVGAKFKPTCYHGMFGLCTKLKCDKDHTLIDDGLLKAYIDVAEYKTGRKTLHGEVREALAFLYKNVPDIPPEKTRFDLYKRVVHRQCPRAKLRFAQYLAENAESTIRKCEDQLNMDD